MFAGWLAVTKIVKKRFDAKCNECDPTYLTQSGDVVTSGETGAKDPELKYDYEGYWEHTLREDGQSVEIRMRNTFTHKTKPDKILNADWVLMYKRVRDLPPQEE